MDIKKNNRNEKIICDMCGTEYMKCNKSHHNNSKRHKDKEKDEEIKKLLTVNNLEKKDLRETILKEEVNKKVKETLEKEKKNGKENERFESFS